MSSSFSFSSLSACICFSSSPICAGAARAGSRPGAAPRARSTWVVAALKSASGLEPSAEENWRTRSSRDLASDSATTSRTRFCTEAELPSEKSFCELLGELAVLRPEHLVDLGRRSAPPPCAPCSVNSWSSWREAFSNSVRTYSALADACSRSSTRAPIAIASVTVLTGSSPACSRSRTSRAAALVLDHQAVDGEPVADGADVGLPEWCCGFHGLSSRTLRVRPDGTAEVAQARVLRRRESRRASRAGRPAAPAPGSPARRPRASRPAGRASIAGRRSSSAISRRTLVASW